MKILTSLQDAELRATLTRGGVAVIRTDTLYGLVASASDPKAVQKVYDLKDRNEHKACIVLIADLSQLLPGTHMDKAHSALMDKYWPGPVTIIMPVVDTQNLDYLTRGNGSLAYRLPDSSDLRELIRRTGPLIAPSANPEGAEPARSVGDAAAYFGEAVDAYVDSGEVKNATASRIITVNESGEEQILR